MEETMTRVTSPSLIKSKLKAVGIHFGISSVIFLILAYFIIFRWYPLPYFTAEGGWHGIRIIALVDLVLGPLMTLIIFNANKSIREIRFDLGIIAMLQISVLIWGIYTVQNERPAAVIHWDGAFYTVPAKSFKEQGISLDKLDQFSDGRPPLIHAHRSTDIDTLHEVLRLSTEENLAPFEQFHLYRPFKENRQEIFAHQVNIHEIIHHNEEMEYELERFLNQSNGRIEDYIYMPLNARYHNIILIFSENGDIHGTLNAPYKNYGD